MKSQKGMGHLMLIICIAIILAVIVGIIYLVRETIKKNVTNKDLIISLGGGAFEDQLTQELLLKNSTVIYLKTSPNIILERIKNNTNRPLLRNQMTVEKIQSIILQRQKNYELANITILTDNKNTDKIVEEILGVI